MHLVREGLKMWTHGRYLFDNKAQASKEAYLHNPKGKEIQK